MGRRHLGDRSGRREAKSAGDPRAERHRRGHAEFWSAGKTVYDPAQITVPTLIAIGEWDQTRRRTWRSRSSRCWSIRPASGCHAGRRHASHDAGEEPRGAVQGRAGVPRRRLRVNCPHDSSPAFIAGLLAVAAPRPRTPSARCNFRRCRRSPPSTAWWWRRRARAALIGAEVLKRGGNAVDAAVAVGFAMAVTYPRAGNIGGGGFMLIHLARGKKDIAIDYRETAPARDHQGHVPQRAGRGRSGEIARPWPCHRRARHGRRPDPGAYKIRLGQIRACHSSSRRRSIWPATATRSATNSRTPGARRSRAWLAGPRPPSCSSSLTAR